MAITSYSTLKIELIAYHKRGTTLDAVVDTFIDNAEATFNRELRVYQQEEETDLTTDASGNATLPTDYLTPISVRRIGSPNVELEPISMGGENRNSPFDTAGIARWYSISGTTLRVTPIEAGTMRLTYREHLPALSTSNENNWLLDLYPDAYLFMVLGQVFHYAREYEAAGANTGAAMQIVERINNQGALAKYNNAGIVLDGAFSNSTWTS